MTICLKMNLKDKVILASDSAVRIDNIVPENSYTSHHGQKLFEFPNNVGCLHFGAGRIGMKTIEELIQEFKDNNDIPTNNLPVFITNFMNFIKDKLIQFPTSDYIIGFVFTEIHNDQTPLSYQIQITGYANEIGEYIINGPFPIGYVCSPSIDAFGDIDFAKLFLDTPTVYQSMIKNNNLSKKQINLFTEIMDNCNNLEETLDVSEEEGIELIKFLMKTIINSTNEYRKIEVVGEPIDIAVVSKNGFKWIQRKTNE